VITRLLRTRISQFDEQAVGYKILWLNMTSQRWLTDNDTDRSIWWHWIAIIVPDTLDPAFADRGLMYMTGGNQGPAPPKVTSEDLIIGAVLAQTCQTVVTVLFQIPNSPVRARHEDRDVCACQ
jgi:PhoPQ-activated pathogenicity-related protein